LIALRLERVCREAEIVANGNEEREVKTGSGEKAAGLSATIDSLSARLAESCESLQRETRERRLAEEKVRRLGEELAWHMAAAEAANRELESFSHSVSHDLRAPLRAIDDFSRVVIDEYAGTLDVEGRRLLDVIRSNAQRMGRLIDDILAFSRIGRREMNMGAIDMERMAREEFRKASGRSPGRDLRFVAKGLPRAFGDAALIRQALSNLLDNAIKFTRPNGAAVIEINGREDDRETVYCVKDNGVGFDMRYAGKLFQVFQRLHSSSEFEGTGVGLAVVQRIVHRHGGRVCAEGAPGAGASFYLTFPKSAGAPEGGGT
jgi:light-regulated signal transduction histidine kinase (bacteriophytochrome)